MGNQDTPLHRLDEQQKAQEEVAPLSAEEKSLNRQIAELLGVEKDYEHSLDAVEAEIPREWFDLRIGVLLTGGYSAAICEDDPPMGYKHRWMGKGDTRQQAAARALLAFAEWKAKQQP